jgi:hypothetical protein
MANLSAPSLQSLLRNVRLMLNQPNPTNSFWTDEELVVYLNEGIRVYFAELVTSSGEGQFTTTTDLAIAAGVETVALPTDCHTIKNVWRKDGTNYISLNYRQLLDSDIDTETQTTSQWNPTYYFRGNNLVLSVLPATTDATGIRIEYVQFPTTLVDGGDALSTQVSPVFRQVIEMYAVYKAKLKESMVNGVTVHAIAKENLNELYMQFKDALIPRSKNPQYVQPFNPEG